jgi:hypothetical protein
VGDLDINVILEPKDEKEYLDYLFNEKFEEWYPLLV